MSRECNRCGSPAGDEDQFCSSCGLALPVVKPESPSETTGTHTHPSVTDSGSLRVVGEGAVADAVGASAFLIVRRGPNEGTSFTLDADFVTVGRDSSAMLFLDDVTVSRRHAEFRREGSTWTVRAAGSLNGTYVNRERIDSVELKGGDEVQLGKYRFVFLQPGVS